MGGGYNPVPKDSATGRARAQQDADLAASKAAAATPAKGAQSKMVIDNSNAAPGAKDFDAKTGEWVNPADHSRNKETAPKLDPTLTDLLLRDLATGQVRRTRAGSRRATFGGSTMNPYDTPTLGG